MAFTFKSLSIEAIVENGLGTFEIGSNNAFVNSINSITIAMSMGGVAEIEINLTPSFTQAINIIDGGFLGYGSPLPVKGKETQELNVINGVAQSVAGNQRIQSSSSVVVTGQTATSLSVRVGYADGPDQKTPWIVGAITAPNLSFGTEINITLKATSTAHNTLMNADTVRTLNAISLYDAINKIVKEDAGKDPVWLDQAKDEAKKIIISSNQIGNSAFFIKHQLESRGFRYFYSGGDDKFPFENLIITSLPAIANQLSEVVLRMYGQIDPNNNIFPLMTFETNIDHTLITGSYFGIKYTVVDAETKMSERVEVTPSDYNKKIKISGNTTPTPDDGKKVKNGFTKGPASQKDPAKAGKRHVIVKDNVNDMDGGRNIENESAEITSKGLTANVTMPFCPKLKPAMLVRVEIYSGDESKPMFQTVSGIYKIIKLTHTIGDSGAETSLELHREIGAKVADKATTAKIEPTVVDKSDEAPQINATLIGGIPSNLA